MKKLLGFAIVGIVCIGSLVWALVGGRATDQKRQRLVITGSSTIAPLASEMAKRFERLNPGVRIDIQLGGSSRGILDVRKRLAQIGMVSRSLNTADGRLTAHRIARDGIAVIVHRSNPIKELTRRQLVGIYTGRITNWSQLGGPDGQITVVNKASGRSTLQVFLASFTLKETQIKAHVVIGDNEQGIKTVATNPLAIGYVSIGTAEYSANHGVAIRLLPLDGIQPSVANVRSGRYPIARTLNLVTLGPPGDLASRFLGFAKSKQVQDLIRAQYFVPLLD